MKFLKKLVSKPFVIGTLILLQLALLLVFIYELSNLILQAYFFLVILSLITVIYIINKNENPSYKLSWAILILSVPIFGGILYLIFGGKKIPKALRSDMVKSANEKTPYLIQDHKVLERIYQQDAQLYKQVNYLWRNVYFPVYRHTKTTYLSIGEDKFEKMKEELRKAEKFIFLEYFIIKEGIMWQSIEDILIEKAKAGVDVRLIYDDFGSMNLPRNFSKRLRALGIKVFAFNPFRPVLAIRMNNRDHRKICVVDGRVGFIGGINLADEYINAIVRFGHWKDSAVMIEGEAVWSLSVMFLTFYNYLAKTDEDILKFKPEYPELFDSDGYVQPFSDSPTDDENVGETAHMNMINMAKEYVYIQTPYLVIGYEFVSALTTAAKNGVDVRIMLPHIPDKWYVHAITRSNYERLIRDGVKIFEYKPGFVHSKTMISDDEAAIVGTTNMDYRSYYMHFECGIYFIESRVVKDLKKDFEQTLDQCIEITLEDCLRVKFFVRIGQAILNLFSALL